MPLWEMMGPMQGRRLVGGSVGGRWALGVDEAMAEFDRTRVLSEGKKGCAIALLLYCWNSNRRGDCDELDSAVL